MKKAYLVPWTNTRTGEEGYAWETPSEKQITGDFAARRQALDNAPDGYKHYECGRDGWESIPTRNLNREFSEGR